ncbi:TetR/AcrR family transcriptional regulator [Streptomyces sp. SA15]|uniref:TetR/AcrR family transcriptional regulator n=1 Tax=Streptomyces sp. SA15 TaxID=934019 RepID=UPI0026D7CA89
MAYVSAAERRPQLTKAAIDLMSREGVAAGSTRAIAAELGVAQATVHYTFGTKEGLYQAVLEQLTENLVVQVERAAPGEVGFEETTRVATCSVPASVEFRKPSCAVCVRSAVHVRALATPGVGLRRLLADARHPQASRSLRTAEEAAETGRP